ncbi:ParB family protein [Methylotuvimicrobium sp. KM1]|uniref:ParB family protein n=1 Tax=Methylotuvimicrobium sp. KM1 TaxID=3377707 RepID=UPI00384AC39A
MTSRPKRLSQDEVQGLLLEGHFGSNNSEEALPASDPITPVQLVLALNEIKAYDHNPRRERNPAYEEIKTSIREQRGLNNPFNVTRRPGETRYMVQSGGNTRLAILNELYRETGDEIFNRVHCLFVPWQSESSVLCSHLIENEIRGDMALIDKAYAIRELQMQMEAEAETTFSRSEFCKRVKEKGYSLSRRHLIRFDYALELDQSIPVALRSGLGANRIDAIKNTEKAYRQYCQDKTDHFAPLFADVMSAHDGEHWDFDAVRRALDKKLAVYIDTTAQRLRLEVDALLFKQTAADDEYQPNSMQQPVDTDDGRPPDAAIANVNLESDGKSPTNSVDNQKQKPTHKPETPPNRDGDGEAAASDEERRAAAVERPDDFLDPDLNESDSILDDAGLESLQDRSYALAKRIAKSIDREHLVLPIEQGMGFVIEKPDQAFTSHDSWGLWWLLLGIAEQSVSEERMPFWDHTALYRLSAVDKAEQLQQLVGPAPSLAMYPHEVLQNPEVIGDPVFNDIFRLMETCRLIRHRFSSTRLWPIRRSA